MKKILGNMMSIAAILLISSNQIFAADGVKPPSSISNPFVLLLSIIIISLALVIGVLANMVIKAAVLKVDKDKKETGSHHIAATFFTLILVFSSFNLFAQDKAIADSTSAIATKAFASGLGGVSESAYYLLGSVVFLEVVLIVALLLMLKSFIQLERKAEGLVATKVEAAVNKVHWWDKINDFKPIQQEADIDLGHDYDGIRELDNRLPPWWIYGFYCCIIFAVIYLWRYHVDKSAPLSKEEYEISVAKADEEKTAYLEKSANNVDENTVKLLTDEASLEAGKKNFQTICAACHLATGGGNVGPNLTDDYWLHGGNIKDVFKTIKYGYQEKGMKSWKDDFSPVQIAQLASYVKSLHGTNPVGAKAPQGDLYKEDSTTAPKK